MLVTKENGDAVTVYLDAEYYVEFKSVEKREVQGNEMEIATVIGDYKEVGGLMFAHSMEVAMGGTHAAQVITFDKVELDIDHAAFLLGRGISAIVRAALESSPERLSGPKFED